MTTILTLSAIIALLFGTLAVTLTLRQRQIINESEAFCVDYSQYDYSTLETGLIGDMIDTYKNNQLLTINTGMSKSDTIHLDLDYKVADKFFYNIKKGVEANSNNPNNEKLGIRIYFGAYPQNMNLYEDLNDLDHSKHAMRLTNVLVPIRLNSNGKVVVFNPLDSDTYETGLPEYIKPDNIKGNLKDNSPEALTPVLAITARITNTVEETLARNHGTIFP